MRNVRSHERAANRQNEATDLQTDQLMYGLYGLTDAEIRVVEEAGAFATSAPNSV